MTQLLTDNSTSKRREPGDLYQVKWKSDDPLQVKVDI